MLTKRQKACLVAIEDLQSVGERATLERLGKRLNTNKSATFWLVRQLWTRGHVGFDCYPSGHVRGIVVIRPLRYVAFRFDEVSKTLIPLAPLPQKRQPARRERAVNCVRDV
jgi:hypothetical protein